MLRLEYYAVLRQILTFFQATDVKWSQTVTGRVNVFVTDLPRNVLENSLTLTLEDCEPTSFVAVSLAYTENKTQNSILISTFQNFYENFKSIVAELMTVSKKDVHVFSVNQGPAASKACDVRLFIQSGEILSSAVFLRWLLQEETLRQKVIGLVYKM